MKIRPVLRYPGSKYKKIDKIIKILDINKNDRFMDMFGGSGIVGVNVKKMIGCKTIINDYDNVLQPITKEYAEKNMTTFGGYGKNKTKAALEYFKRRIKNGYWEKLKIYNEVLEKCIISNRDWNNLNDWTRLNLSEDNPNKFYVDPPYHNIKGLYKSDYDEDAFKQLKWLLEDQNYNGKCKILISLNDTPFIRELFSDWYILEEEFTYCSGRIKKNKRTKELFITNWKVVNNG